MCERLQAPSAGPRLNVPRMCRGCARDPVLMCPGTSRGTSAAHSGVATDGRLRVCGEFGLLFPDPRFGEPGHIGPMRAPPRGFFHEPLPLDRPAEGLSPRG